MITVAIISVYLFVLKPNRLCLIVFTGFVMSFFCFYLANC